MVTSHPSYTKGAFILQGIRLLRVAAHAKKELEEHAPQQENASIF
ncbi:hypothetical protein RB2083_2619 [Rhodobacteraceae bacterium HTCC2083]|nr:hypothetical protein RB2083_2619 [Rhodobacteraceae bacterium HTCC2083]